ncbi:MaoC/PaaZ C-terminal domain-containing protein [Luteimicrobium sp. NPDC057192]|uniref:MaoC/PaaZ C-terminal domain-containing protein n=1 Tax=Luteimicrobium sp. NPDC057192 TaxID=3346042 RepID=UPI00362DC1D4
MSAGAPGGPDRRTVTLDAVPRLGGLYARGLAGSVTRMRPARGEPVLPDVALRVAGVDTGDVGLRERLASYGRLVGEPASDVLPAGFVHVLAFPVATALMTRDDFPLPLLGMVHLANTVRVARPVVVGDVLEVRAWAQDLRPHRRGAQVDLVTEVRTDPADDAPAWRGVSTYLAKDVTVPATAELSEAHGGIPPRGSDNSRQHPLPTGRWTLDAATGRRYAAVSGDRNPIHLSALSAKALGFPRAIAHGMYTASRALAGVARERGDAYDWSVEFARPVLLPGVVDVSVRPDGARWVYEGWDARKGATHFTGSVVPRG